VGHLSRPDWLSSGWPRVAQGVKFKVPLPRLPRSFIPGPAEYTCQVTSMSA